MHAREWYLVKWDIFMGESEDWEVLRKLRKMGEAIRNFSHLSTKSAKKFKFYAKTFWSTGQPPHKEQGLRWNAQKTEVKWQYLSSDKTTWRVEYRVFHFSWRLSMPGFPRKQNSWKSILLILIWTKFYLIFVRKFKMVGKCRQRRKKILLLH